MRQDSTFSPGFRLFHQPKVLGVSQTATYFFSRAGTLRGNRVPRRRWEGNAGRRRQDARTAHGARRRAARALNRATPSIFTTPSVVHPSSELHMSFSYLVVAPKIRVAKAVNFGSSAKSRPRCHRQRCHGGTRNVGPGERVQATETLPAHETE